jgi:hypothetical protein
MTTLNYQVAETADDSVWTSSYHHTDDAVILGTSVGITYKNALRFQNVTIPIGATITTAYITFCLLIANETPAGYSNIYFEKAATPTQVSSNTDGDSRSLSSAYVAVLPPATGTTWNTGDIKNIIQELVDAYDYSAGAAMQAIVVGTGSGAHSIWQCSYEYDRNWGNTHADAPKLHIEYTAASNSILPLIMSESRRRR